MRISDWSSDVGSSDLDYYGPNVLLYFSQLSGIITLFACGAVLARMRKLHEMAAILASGVSLYRVARPVLVFAVLMTGLLVLATEIGRASCRERVCRNVEIPVGAVSRKKKK